MADKEKHFFFSEKDEADIVAAIKKAELNTSGEVRVRVEHSAKGDAYKRAVEVFEKLGMTQTQLSNGILFYLATDDHKFALIGDTGIHEKVGDDFWKKITDEVLTEFRKGEFAQGLINGIHECGMALSEHFPYQSDDVNELSDDISKGEL